MSSTEKKDGVGSKTKKYSRVFPETEGDEIVVTGMSGRFPRSNNVAEFEHNLYNKIDMVAISDRWQNFNVEISRRFGTIPQPQKFDSRFFGKTPKQASSMDPQLRLLLESTYEAILDAGVNPKSLRGTNTGVYIGASCSETQMMMLFNRPELPGYGVSENNRHMLPNMISYVFGLNGPSMTVDTACSSTMFALDAAFSAIRNGSIDAAIVGGCHMILHLRISVQFWRLGVLSQTGYCRPLDQKAEGYTRAEAVPVIFLRKKRDAKRIYGSIVYTKTNCDGYKTEGVTFPSSRVQEKLLKEFYQECKVEPNSISYIEGHCTGTVAGDPQECHAIDQVLAKKRTEPLPIGSVKSNMGHSEPSSALCSVVKVLLALERGVVPSNINFESVRKDIPALVEGRLVVVDEPLKLKKDLIAVNSFGFGGANAHALFKQHSKCKPKVSENSQDFPSLVLWSGRTEGSVNKMLAKIESMPLDYEYIGLLHGIKSGTIEGFEYRSFGIFSQSPESPKSNAQCLSRQINFFRSKRPELALIFDGNELEIEQIQQFYELLKIPQILDSIKQCSNVLANAAGINLLKIFTSPMNSVSDYYPLCCTTAINIAVIDILRTLDVKINFSVGNSIGAICCAYADEILTLEESILCAYFIEQSRIILNIKKSSNNTNNMTTKTTFKESLKIVSALKKILSHPSDKLVAKRLKFAHDSSINETFIENISSIDDLAKGVLRQNDDFEKSILNIPHDAITLEINPSESMINTINKRLSYGKHFQLLLKQDSNILMEFLSILGGLYLNGIELSIEKLYPTIEFPVSRGTPLISPFVEWEHDKDHFLSTQNIYPAHERVYNISLSDDPYLKGHTIDGRVLLPATLYINLVWETTVAIIKGDEVCDSLEFEDIRFLRATQISEKDVILLTVKIHRASGDFEVTEGSSLIVTGKIRLLKNMEIKPLLINPTNKVMLQGRDFYKELRVRGYHYKDGFRSVHEVQEDGVYGVIKWDRNWVTFMDCILQMMIIGTDSRSLMLPTRIEKLRINPAIHTKMLITHGDTMPVYADLLQRRIVSGGIEMIGLHTSSVERRKAPGVPILERFEFIPHFPTPKVSKMDAIRICVQIATENNLVKTVKVTEFDHVDFDPLISDFLVSIQDLPLLASDLTLVTDRDFKFENVIVNKSKPKAQNNNMFVINSNFLQNGAIADEMKLHLMDSGIWISRESPDLDLNCLKPPQGFNIIANILTEHEILVLMQPHTKKNLNIATPIKISETDTEFKWIKTVSDAIPEESEIILVAENEKRNGLLGLVNCLRKEPNGNTTFRCIFIDDLKAPPFDINHPLYREQLKLGQAINVFRNGKWGSYRHLLLEKSVTAEPQLDHVYATLNQRGDLSSWKWVQGPLRNSIGNIRIIYSSLNFKDVMLASGRLPIESCGLGRLEQLCVIGFEFSGITGNGKRVMGMIPSGALSSHINTDQILLLDVPDKWSMKEAATIPVVYLTVYYAFFFTTDIRKGKTILIHSGTGGIGMAAIRVALAYGLEVYTTVGTLEKKKYLLETFPEIKESNIGNSRDTSFEQMIKIQTKGKGVDFVLNSLSEEKLTASLRCLGRGGHFLEIGKFDMANDNKIGLHAFLNQISFHGVFADHLLNESKHVVKDLTELLTRDTSLGIIQPLPTTVFEASEIEQAFRYMSSGKHMGKVLVEIRENEETLQTHPIEAHPQAYFDPNTTMIIPGGLGGFGLEMIDWMIIRGARKFVICSTRGISKAYQSYRINIWREYGAKIVVMTANITTREGCENLLKEGMKLGPIGGIFNLAVALRDAIFANQTVEKFSECMAPKAVATKYLDELARKMCPQLSYFVTFSSVSCGRGNAGQTNYGMANSVMERIMEERVRQGLPGKAIQWGAIGEVGIVADMAEDKIDMEIGGTLQQRISSCLQELDKLLTSPDPIVASMVVAEKRFGSGANKTIIETVLNIIGIRDLKSHSMQTTLSAAGLDSLMLVEVKQTLERDFEINLTPHELRNLTFQDLLEISQKREIEEGHSVGVPTEANKESLDLYTMLWTNAGSEMNEDKIIIPLKTEISEGKHIKTVLFIPGIEGAVSDIFFKLAENLNCESYGLQLINFKENVAETVDRVITVIENQVYKKEQDFLIVAHSYGSLYALKIARRLEDDGYKGRLVLIDGSPRLLKCICSEIYGATEELVGNQIIQLVMNNLCPNNIKELKEFVSISDWNIKIMKMLNFLKANNNLKTSINYCRKVIELGIYRVCSLNNMDEIQYSVINSPITLVRPNTSVIAGLAEDYELGKLTKQKVDIKLIDGNHVSILKNKELAKIINEINQ